MEETASIPQTFVIETPVLDPAIYLLKRENKVFLEGKSKHVETTPTPLNPLVVSLRLIWVLTALEAFLLALFMAPLQYAVLISLLVLVAVLGRKFYIKLRDRDITGRVLTGIIVQAETIRVLTGRTPLEKVRIRYRFVRPDGEFQDAYIEDSNTKATSLIAPIVGTYVRVWYTSDGKYTLL